MFNKMFAFLICAGLMCGFAPLEINAQDAVPNTPVATQSKGKFVVPEQKILGASEPIPLGELAILRLSPMGKKPDFLVGSAVTWKVYEFVVDAKGLNTLKPKFVHISDGDVTFGTGLVNKNLYCQAIITYAYLDKSSKDVEYAVETVILSTSIILGDGKPVPPPTPPAPPTPPSFPVGKYSLSKFAYETAMSKVEPKNRAKGAACMASGLRVTLAGIASGQIKELEMALNNSLEANTAELNKANISPNEWDEFGNSLKTKLYGLYKSQSLTTVQDLSKAYEELVVGLSAIK